MDKRDDDVDDDDGEYGYDFDGDVGFDVGFDVYDDDSLEVYDDSDDVAPAPEMHKSEPNPTKQPSYDQPTNVSRILHA